ncbi:hypothetical protein AgCh_028956 [Apium graveolens]
MDGPQLSVPKSTSTETLIMCSEKKSSEAKETAMRPLSPYIVYDDLKPPTSPCPKAPGDGRDALAATTTVVDADGVKISESVTSTPEHSAGVGELVFQYPRPYDCLHFTLFSLDLYGLLVAGGREGNYRIA